jgi:hypothetical protein
MTLIPFHTHRASAAPTDEQLERLAVTVDGHTVALARIEQGILALLDRVAALAARMDADR